MDKIDVQENHAFKALFLADGVLFLFREIKPFGPNDVKVVGNEHGELHFELGQNIARITDKIMQELKKHRTFFLYRVPENEYAPDSTPIAFEMEEEVMAKLELLWKRIKSNKAKEGGKDEQS